MEVQASNGLLHGQGLWVQLTWLWHNFLEEVAINPTIELPELTQDWEIDSWGAQTELCVQPDSEERSSDPTRD